MNEEIYPQHVVDASGKFVGVKPFFILWPKWFRMNDHMSAYSLHQLAKHFDGKIAFRFADIYTDEKLRMSYEIYQPGKSFYIDEDGKAYIFPGQVNFDGVKDWIENRKYRMSPFQF